MVLRPVLLQGIEYKPHVVSKSFKDSKERPWPLARYSWRNLANIINRGGSVPGRCLNPPDLCPQFGAQVRMTKIMFLCLGVGVGDTLGLKFK